MECWNTENNFLKDYVELWAGKWRPMDLWTICNISNNCAQSRELESKEVSLCGTEHLRQTQGGFIWLFLRWIVLWHSVSMCWLWAAVCWCPVGQCHSARTGAFALCHWADGSAQGSLHSHVFLAPCHLPMPCAVSESGKSLPRVNLCPFFLSGIVVKGRHHTLLCFQMCSLSTEYTGPHSWILWGGWNDCCSNPLSHTLPAQLAWADTCASWTAVLQTSGTMKILNVINTA